MKTAWTWTSRWNGRSPVNTLNNKRWALKKTITWTSSAAVSPTLKRSLRSFRLSSLLKVWHKIKQSRRRRREGLVAVTVPTRWTSERMKGFAKCLKILTFHRDSCLISWCISPVEHKKWRWEGKARRRCTRREEPRRLKVKKLWGSMKVTD